MNLGQGNKKVIVFIVIAFIVGIIGATIAFATTTTLLSIGEGDNQAVMDPISWKVKWDSTYDIEANTTTSGAATVNIYPEYVSDSVLSDFKATFTRTGDAVTFKLKIVNTGSLNAKIDAVTLGAFTCTGTTGPTKTADETIVCDDDNLVMTLTYDTGGTALAPWVSGTTDTLAAGANVLVNLKLEYIGTNLPTEDVEIAIGNTTVYYVEKV